MKAELIITGKYILTLDSENSVIKDGAVVVGGNKIIDVCGGDEIGAYQAKERIDCGHSIVMPGFVNAHTHAAMVYFRGMADDLCLDDWLNNHIWPAEAKYVNEEFIKKASELACLEMIKAGVVCFNDMYFYPEIMAEVCRRAGIRACLGEPMLGFQIPGRKSYHESLEKTRELACRYKDDELIKISVLPHSPLVAGEEILLKAKEIANELNLLVHTHISETKKEAEEIKKQKGLSAAEYLSEIGFLDDNVIAAHSIWLDEVEIELFQKYKVSVCHNPISNMKLASGVMPIEKMQDKKINICLGTDGAASNNTLDMFSEMRTAALLHKISSLKPDLLSAKEIVMMTVKNGAQALKLNSGSLEKDKFADIITIGLDKPHLTPMYDPYSHLVYCANAADVDNVIINGRVLMRSRKVLGLD
jgi:5-methylthioadenosine/S-adenosylhomocysteine deaminase